MRSKQKMLEDPVTQVTPIEGDMLYQRKVKIQIHGNARQGE